MLGPSFTGTLSTAGRQKSVVGVETKFSEWVTLLTE